MNEIEYTRNLEKELSPYSFFNVFQIYQTFILDDHSCDAFDFSEIWNQSGDPAIAIAEGREGVCGTLALRWGTRASLGIVPLAYNSPCPHKSSKRVRCLLIFLHPNHSDTR